LPFKIEYQEPSTWRFLGQICLQRVTGDLANCHVGGLCELAGEPKGNSFRWQLLSGTRKFPFEATASADFSPNYDKPRARHQSTSNVLPVVVADIQPCGSEMRELLAWPPDGHDRAYPIKIRNQLGFRCSKTELGLDQLLFKLLRLE
jgi:hypothetical protein